MNKSIGKKLADLTNPTFSSISVNSVLYDIVKTKTNNNEDCLCKNQVF